LAYRSEPARLQMVLWWTLSQTLIEKGGNFLSLEIGQQIGLMSSAPPTGETLSLNGLFSITSGNMQEAAGFWNCYYKA
jgi:hypothetical protein